MVNFEEAIRRPFKDSKKLCIGTIIYLVSILLFVISPILCIIPMFFVLGYTLECARTAIKKKLKLPEWKDWINLWRKGFLAFLIAIIYMAPLIIITVATIGSTIIKNIAIFITLDPDPSLIASFFGSLFGSIGLILIILIPLTLLTFYVLPIAIIMFAEKSRFGDAFKLGKVFRKAFTSKYLIASILLYGYTLVMQFIFAILSIITTITIIIPLILVSVFIVIIMITSMTIFGEVYSEIK